MIPSGPPTLVVQSIFFRYADFQFSGLVILTLQWKSSAMRCLTQSGLALTLAQQNVLALFSNHPK